MRWGCGFKNYGPSKFGVAMRPGACHALSPPSACREPVGADFSFRLEDNYEVTESG